METPKEKLKKITAWDVAPLLTDTEIDELLLQAAKEDAAGNSPSNEDWEPTYDLNSAASNAGLSKPAEPSPPPKPNPTA